MKKLIAIYALSLVYSCNLLGEVVFLKCVQDNSYFWDGEEVESIDRLSLTIDSENRVVEVSGRVDDFKADPDFIMEDRFYSKPIPYFSTKGLDLGLRDGDPYDNDDFDYWWGAPNRLREEGNRKAEEYNLSGRRDEDQSLFLPLTIFPTFYRFNIVNIFGVNVIYELDRQDLTLWKIYRNQDDILYEQWHKINPKIKWEHPSRSEDFKYECEIDKRRKNRI